MINLTPLLTGAADWGCHAHLLPHHLVSLDSSVSLAKAVIKGAADYSAVSPGTDGLLCHQQLAVVGFILFNPLLLGRDIFSFFIYFFLYFSTEVCWSLRSSATQCVSVHKGSATIKPQSIKLSELTQCHANYHSRGVCGATLCLCRFWH